MPSTPSEFEEKEFEAPLYNQIGSGTHLVWSPGQVFEEHIGIDYAFMLDDPDLWRFFGANAPLSGAYLHRHRWGFIWQRRKKRQLPNFRLNLFIQAKRSHYYRRPPKHLISRLAKGPCWRFDIEKHQQEALEKVAEKLGDRAVVCYGAPVFHRLSQLYAHTSRRSILPNSIFPGVTALSDHQSFYYQAPEGGGIANAEPTKVDGAPLKDMLRRLSESSPETVRNDPRTELKSLGEEIYTVVTKEISDESPRKAIFMEMLGREEELADITEGPVEAIKAFVRVAVFALAFDCEWLVVSHAQGE